MRYSRKLPDKETSYLKVTPCYTECDTHGLLTLGVRVRGVTVVRLFVTSAQALWVAKTPKFRHI